ncbi:hypothetical protein HYE82_31340 [Streptomyces sp. BR123]|uniref:hypothetical protein n=1 Tax=Streptomyces sp. BR123 TaxID=2749828 RepID=UPI0015C485F0|nr:hypothetical protein [Streptomyces sp. BR123]NXY98796.1 hypothetical protein [Streptomyces sp. BR123]
MNTQVTPPRLRIAAGYKRGAGPLVTQAVIDFEAAARLIAEFAGLDADDMLDSQIEACGRARTAMADARTTLARTGHLHLIDHTVPVPAVDRRVLRLRTHMRAAGYNPGETHGVQALADRVGIDRDRLTAVLTGRALYDHRIPQRRLADALGLQHAA